MGPGVNIVYYVPGHVSLRTGQDYEMGVLAEAQASDDSSSSAGESCGVEPREGFCGRIITFGKCAGISRVREKGNSISNN